MRDKRRKKFYYKLARFENSSSTYDLQKLIAQVCKVDLPTAVERFYEATENDRWFINRFMNINGMFCGQFLSYEKDKSVSLIEIDPSAKELVTSPIKPEGNNEFEDGHLYFAVLSNHVILAQSATLKSKEFEQYLHWLLSITNASYADGVLMRLNDYTPLADKNLAGTDFIEILSPFDSHQTLPEETIKTKSLNILSAVSEFLGFSLDEPDFTEDVLEARLVLKYRSTRRTHTAQSLDVIANKLRHIDDEITYRIRTKSGEDITQEDYKLRHDFNIECDDGIPVMPHIFEKMSEFLSDLTKEGKINL